MEQIVDDTVLQVSTSWIISSAWSLLVGLVVLTAGWFIAKVVSDYVTGLLSQRLRHDQTIAPLVGQIVRYAILFVTIVVVLGQFGVQTASILAVLGAAGLAIALALQGALSNIAAGIMLVFLRPFNAGDYIDADGIVGTVVEIGLFASRLRTRDGIYIFAPNSKLSNARIINYSREPSRMVEISFAVPRSADLDVVRSAVSSSLQTQFSAPDAQPEILVEALGDSTVIMTARVPVKSREWWTARSLLQERLKQTLDSANGFAQAQPQ